MKFWSGSFDYEPNGSSLRMTHSFKKRREPSESKTKSLLRLKQTFKFEFGLEPSETRREPP